MRLFQTKIGIKTERKLLFSVVFRGSSKPLAGMPLWIASELQGLSLLILKSELHLPPGPHP